MFNASMVGYTTELNKLNNYFYEFSNFNNI